MRFKYTPDNKGLREIGRSAQVQQECLEAGRKIADRANELDPNGDYQANPATVQAGWENEDRAGAVVEQTQPSRLQNRALLTALEGSAQ